MLPAALLFGVLFQQAATPAKTETPAASSAATMPAQPLPELTSASVSTLSSLIPPSRCGIDGTFYSRIAASRTYSVQRFSRDLAPDQTFSFDTTAHPELAGYTITDFTPDPAGGIYALVAQPRNTENPRRTQVLAHFETNGTFSGLISIRNVVPRRAVAFSNGTLLISGFSTEDPDDSKGPKWVTGIYRPDGTLLRQLTYTPPADPAPKGKKSSAPNETSHSATAQPAKTKAEAKPESDIPASGSAPPQAGELPFDLNRHVETLQLLPAPNGNIYASLPGQVEVAGMKSGLKLAEIAPTGEVRIFAIPDVGQKWYARAIVTPTRVFVFSPDKQDVIYEFYLNDAAGTLDWIGNVSVTGTALCASESEILTIRGTGANGHALALFQVR